MKKKLISGIMVTIFLVTMITVAFPARVSAQFVGDIKIGIVGPKGWIQWDGLWEGAQMARDEINDAGGMVGPDGRYRVVLVDIDEYSVPSPDPTAAIAELIAKVDANPDMQFLIGGFRTECVQPMSEAAMDYAAVNGRPIWFIDGAATDSLISVVQTNYDRYKYMFRVFPMNLTMIGAVLFYVLIKQIAAPKLAALYYGNLAKLVPAFIIAENLPWCDWIVFVILNLGQLAGIDVKGVARTSPNQTNFTSEFNAAEAAGAKLVIHIFSAAAGFSFVRQWGLEKRRFACIGINVESMEKRWGWTGELEYETILAPVGTETNMNPDAKPLSTAAFWDDYVARWGHAPLYTSWGAYDAIIALNETSYDSLGSGQPSAGKGWMVHWQSGDIDKLIEHTETLGVSDGFAWKRELIGGSYFRNSILGKFKFTGQDGKGHDVFCTAYSLSPLHDGVVRPLVVQWQAGRMEVVWPQDQPYSRKWMVPPWMYNLETDFAGGPLIPTGILNYNYTSPDQTVSAQDLLALTDVWFQVPSFNLLEADMTPQDHFIDIYDLAKIGKDWNEVGTPQ